MCLGTFSRRARSIATYFFFVRVRIPRSAFLLDRKCDAISYMVKISHQVIFNRMPKEKLEPYGNLFRVGRRVMICCAADIQFLSVQCHCPEESVPEDQAWILLTATGTLRTDLYGQKTLLLEAKKIQSVKPPKSLVIGLF